MPQHGEHDLQQQKWFCGYWMSQEEWLDIHDYAPSVPKEEMKGDSDED
jgi:hypothetical protein